MTQKLTKFHLFWGLLTAASILVTIFTNFSYDAEYQLAMGLRMLQGDELILEMWEPHQTSAFFMAGILWLYHVFVPSWTGVVLYTQLVGILCRVLVGYVLFRTLRKAFPFSPAYFAFLLFVINSPKELLTPEFSNLPLWCAVLCFCLLVSEENRYYPVRLALGALLLCGAIFSYPSCLILYFACAWTILKHSKKKGISLLIFTGVCILIGGSFAAYLLLHVGWDIIRNVLECALSIEPTHTVPQYIRSLTYLRALGMVFAMLSACAGIALIPSLISLAAARSRKMKVTRQTFSVLWLELSCTVLLLFFAINIFSGANRGGYAVPLLALMGAGLVCSRRLNPEQALLFRSAYLFGLSLSVAALLLSDQPLLQDVAFALPSACVSVLSVYEWIRTLDSRKLANGLRYSFYAYFLLFAVRSFYLHIPLYERSQIYTLRDEFSLIRTGPAAGIISSDESVIRQRDSYAEWDTYIKPGSRIWLLGNPVDTLAYFYSDTEIAAPSVMSTPTYNDSLRYYWELNPEKYPDVVILTSSYGTTDFVLASDTWLMDWLENDYRAAEVTDGTYWRFYYRDPSLIP